MEEDWPHDLPELVDYPDEDDDEEEEMDDQMEDKLVCDIQPEVELKNATYHNHVPVTDDNGFIKVESTEHISNMPNPTDNIPWRDTDKKTKGYHVSYKVFGKNQE